MAYEARYRARTTLFRRPIGRDEVERAVAQSDVVYVGDYHTLRVAQSAFLSLVRAAAAGGRPVVLALEFFEGAQQSALDAFLSGSLSESRFLKRTGHSPDLPGSLWPGFRPILEEARRLGLRVLAIDKRAEGPRALELRDRFAAQRVAQAAAGPQRPLVLVLMGQFHVVPEHLPRAVERALGPSRRRKHLVVYQNCEGVYWRLARQGRHPEVEAVELREGELCLINASPLTCQQSYLDYLESCAGTTGGDDGFGMDAAVPAERASTEEQLRTVARSLAAWLGFRGNLDRCLEGFEVLSCDAEGLLSRLRVRRKVERRSLAALRQRVARRACDYLPELGVLFLPSPSLHHAAEVAVRLVRDVGLGATRREAASPNDAFYAQCVEEALGFLGSKVLNPHRRSVELGQWAQRFLERPAHPDRKVAAFVLAHKAAEPHGAAAAAKCVPRSSDLLPAVAQGLGYLLGDALFQSLQGQRARDDRLRELLVAPMAEPVDCYFELLRRAQESRKSARASAGVARVRPASRARRAASATNS